MIDEVGEADQSVLLGLGGGARLPWVYAWM